MSVSPEAGLHVVPVIATEDVVSREIRVPRLIDDLDVLLPSAVREANEWVGCLELHFRTTNRRVRQDASFVDPHASCSLVPSSDTVRRVVPIDVAYQVVLIIASHIQG